MKQKTNISNVQIDLLKHEIYMVLLAGYDNEGNELGMGEMGECEDAADTIIKDWCEKANIEIVITELLYLESVGCYLEVKDNKEPITYPACLFKPDYDNGVELSECTDEWFETLSKEDKQLIWDIFEIDVDAIDKNDSQRFAFITS